MRNFRLALVFCILYLVGAGLGLAYVIRADFPNVVPDVWNNHRGGDDVTVRGAE